MSKFRLAIEMIFLALFILILLVFGVFWLERINVLPTTIISDMLNKSFLFRNSNQTNENVVVNDSLLIDKIRLEKQAQELNKQKIEIEESRRNLEVSRQQLVDDIATVELTKQEIEEQKKTLNQIINQLENKNERVREVTVALLNMPPQNAVDILVEYDDELIIDTLLEANKIAADEGVFSIVPYWLSLMDAKRASEVQKKLVYNN